MRSPTTRVIVGLLLLTGIATSGLKQAGFLTGTVIQNSRMQFRAASPYAEMGANGVITIPTGTDILLDWSEIGGAFSSMQCHLYASRAIDGIPASKTSTFTIPNYGVRQVSAVTQDTSFTIVCDKGDGYSPPYTTQTIQVKVGGANKPPVLYDHRAIQYPATAVPLTFTVTSGSSVNGTDNVLDIKKGSDVTISWTSTGTQDACSLSASDLVDVPTDIPAGTLLSPGNVYTGGKLSNILNNHFNVHRTGSMTLHGVTKSFSVLLGCVTSIPPGGGSAQGVLGLRAVYVQPDIPVPPTPSFYATAPDGTFNDANGVIQVPSGSAVQLTSNVGTGNCNPFSSLGSANWDGNHRTDDWPKSGVLVPAPCTRTVSIPNVTQSQTFYLDVGMARTDIRKVSVVVQPAAGAIAGIGGAPSGTFRAFGPSGQVSTNGTIAVPGGSTIVLEWNQGPSYCNTFSTNGSANWDGGKTSATWGAADYFNNYCSGIVSIPNVTSTQTFSMDVGNARTNIATLTVTIPTVIAADPSQCSDGIDNDNDGLKDSADPGCAIRQGHEDDNTGMCTLNVYGANRSLATPDLGPPLSRIALGTDGGIWFRTELIGFTSMSTAGAGTSYTWSGTDSSYGVSYFVKGSDNNMWFTKDGTTIVKRTPSGVVTSYTLSHPPRTLLALGSDGNIWGLNGNLVIKVTPAGVATEYPFPLVQVQDVVAGPDGNLWYTFTNGKVAKLTMAGSLTQYDTGMKYMRGIGAGPDGNVWFVGMNDATAGSGGAFDYHSFAAKITPAGAITTYALPSSVLPNDITSGDDGNLWITSSDVDATPKSTTAGTVSVRTLITRLTPSGQYTLFSVRDMNAVVTTPGTALGTVLKGSDNKIWAMGPTVVQTYQYETVAQVDSCAIDVAAASSSSSSLGLSCKAAEFDATKGTFPSQGWTEDIAKGVISAPQTEAGVSFVRINDNTTLGGPNESVPIPRNVIQDKDFVVEMKARIISSATGRPDLTGGNAFILAPEGRYIALYFDTNKFGTIKNLAWDQTVNKNTADAFHTYAIAYKQNGAGVLDDSFDVYFDGAKVLSDILVTSVAYIPSQSSDSLYIGAVSTDGTAAMDVSYVRFSNNANPCVKYTSITTPECSDGKDNDADGTIDYATEKETLVKNWGPFGITPRAAPVVVATGLQAGQFIRPTLAEGGQLCVNIMRANSNGIYFAGVFTNDAGAYIQALPPNSPAATSIPFVSEAGWPLDIFKVPNGATQLKVSFGGGTTISTTCTLSGKVFEMQRSPNWPGDLDCSSADDTTEAGMSCTDSDGGNTPLVKGFVNATGGSVSTGADACDVSGRLTEYFCDTNKAIKSSIALCEQGYTCFDGACKAGSTSSAAVINLSRVGFGGIAFDGNDMIFMPLQNGDASYHGNVLSFGPVCKPGVCGDGTLTSDEQCDDKNTNDGDGCSAKCIWEQYAVSSSSSRSSVSSSSSSSSSSSISSSFSSSFASSSSTETFSSSSFDNSFSSNDSSFSSSFNASSVSSFGSCTPGTICPNGAICPQDGICPGVCIPGTVCPTGAICPADGFCTGVCSPGTVCPNGAVCPASGICPESSSSSSSSSSLFAGCSVNADCMSNLCIGGVCGCSSNMQCGGNACLGGFCTNIPGTVGDALAFATCSSQAECPIGMLCQEGFCAVNASLCGNGRIDAGETCDDGNSIETDSCSTGCLFANDMACTNPRQCQSLICTDGICGRCTQDTQCPDDMICLAGACTEGSREGAVLSNNILIPAELASLLASGTGFSLFADGTSYEQYQAMLLQHGAPHAPVGNTGPESVAVMAAGASAGYTWMKMKKKKK